MVAKRTSGDAASLEAAWQQYRAPLELYDQLRTRPVSALLKVAVLVVLIHPQLTLKGGIFEALLPTCVRLCSE